ncbi:MAG: OmpA family protein [Comamonadaceae bacterium]|nr:OmpA family protein [Comamonadaceae bacterium]
MSGIRVLSRWSRRLMPLALGAVCLVGAAQEPDVPLSAWDMEFPAIPQIVVPDLIGVGPAQAALQQSLKNVLDPMAGIRVRAARCSADGALLNDAGMTSLDAQGQLRHSGEKGIFRVNPDGSGTANFKGGLVRVNADGSGSINGSGQDGYDEGVIRVEADGSGSYNGRHGLIRLDGKGGGSWNGRSGQLRIHGDGSGTWTGPRGQVRINADGSGTWNGGPHGRVINHGDGTGRIGPPPGRAVKMAPIPKVAPAGRFPRLDTFTLLGTSCGFVITLGDQVLFDFDKSAIRPDAAQVLDALAQALKQVRAKSVEIRGHTDSKGSEAYNQGLSERRAQSVLAALRARGAGQSATAQGYGEGQPVAPNALNGQDNPTGRQLNRRVEIFVQV